MSLKAAIQISSQGLSVQRKRMQIVAGNIANISTTNTPEGGPYRRRLLIVEAQAKSSFTDVMDQAIKDQGEAYFDDIIQGVRATEVRLDASPFIRKYEPDHPDAAADGYVSYPNVNPANEMVDMVGISRSFEANLSVIRSAKDMLRESIELLRS